MEEEVEEPQKNTLKEPIITQQRDIDISDKPDKIYKKV